jgi:alpha-mannosidase
MDFDLKALRERALEVKKRIYTPIAQLSCEGWRTAEPVPYERRTEGEHITPAVGEKWGELWDCAWFHVTGRVPESAAGKHVVLLLDFAGEACVFDETGTPVRGLTNVSSEFDKRLGEPGKRVLQFANPAAGGEIVDLWIEAGCNDLFGRYCDEGKIVQLDIAVCDDELRDRYYDLVTVGIFASAVQDETRKEEAANAAISALEALEAGDTGRAGEILSAELSKKNPEDAPEITAIGHAHIDLAWLWPIRETKRKGGRTFATVNELMDRYPDYVFGASQPQLLQWVKDMYPGLYAKIKQRHKEGRFEVQGGLWVECDTNVTGGESLVRQLLYGKRFWREEFGCDQKMLWLPDVFGYSAQVPQIMKKSGIDYFMTIKMSWNRVNKIPYHTFKWRAIDGSEVLAHMPPEGTYNSGATPRSIIHAWNNFAEKKISNEALLLFGIGDGGGGPGPEHLELLAREKDYNGLPRVKQGYAIDFFKRIEKDIDKYDTWVGELYFELHQGTYTTQGRNKYYNRRCEQALRDAEMYSAAAERIAGVPYPAGRFEEIWKEILLYQFHDIIPGSSIKRVYDESLARYGILLAEINSIKEKALTALAEVAGGGKLAFNSLPFDREEYIKTKRGYAVAKLPAMGWAKLKSAKSSKNAITVTSSADGYVMENNFVRVTFGADGSVMSIYDKSTGREALRAPGNILTAYEDKENAWEIPWTYEQNPHERAKLESSSLENLGYLAVLTQVYKYNDSTITQKIIMYSGSARIDFVTEVDWRETHRMLRTSFPTTVKTTKADCEIQFGNIERPTIRNTSWDKAKVEVCAHKWVDFSQRDYGVAMLSDSKYGFRVWDCTFDINLLRSSMSPGKDADKGVHNFTYSIYPHKGDYVEGGVIAEGYKLNIKPTAAHSKKGSRELTGKSSVKLTGSLFEIDNPAVVLETVKRAEDGSGVVVRVYESTGSRASFTLKPNKAWGFTAAQACNLVEENPENISFDGTLCDEIGPFEIKTYILK